MAIRSRLRCSPGRGLRTGLVQLTGGVIRTGFGGLPSINAVPVGLQQPRIQQYNATFRARAYARYVHSPLLSRQHHEWTDRGVDLNEIPPSDVPFGTTIGDGVTPCSIQSTKEIATILPADLARQPLPGLGDFLASYGNFGHGRSNAFQAQFERRYAHGLMFNLVLHLSGSENDLFGLGQLQSW